MQFKSHNEQLDYLKRVADKIAQMEHDRKVCVLRGDFQKAYSLLKGIKFARSEFAKQSKKYAKK